MNSAGPTLVIIEKWVSPSLINLKGKKHQLGDSLEKGSENIVYIGRQMYMGGWRIPKSKWFNPYPVKKHGLEESLKMYRTHLAENQELINSLAELNGKKLACWCHPQPCHGQVLIEFFNFYCKNN
jgi:hypothetical protein